MNNDRMLPALWPMKYINYGPMSMNQFQPLTIIEAHEALERVHVGYPTMAQMARQLKELASKHKIAFRLGSDYRTGYPAVDNRLGEFRQNQLLIWGDFVRPSECKSNMVLHVLKERSGLKQGYINLEMQESVKRLFSDLLKDSE